MGYDDIETPVATGSDILGFRVRTGFQLPFISKTPEGCRVGMVAPVGMDFSDAHQKLEDLGIDFSGVSKLPGKTFRWSGRYSGSMDNVETISTDKRSRDFNPEIPGNWRSPEFILCQHSSVSQVSVLDQCPESEITN